MKILNLCSTKYKIFNIRSPDFEEIAKLLKSPIIFDGRNIYHTLHLESKGFEYHQIGVRNASIQP